MRSSRPSTKPRTPTSSTSSPRTSPPSPPTTPPTSLAQTSRPPKLKAIPKRRPTPNQSRRPGKRLLSFDRRIGARYVAGADEAGRGSLAGPLVVAGVLLDYAQLRDHKVRPLALLNGAKQVAPGGPRDVHRATVGTAERSPVRSRH